MADAFSFSRFFRFSSHRTSLAALVIAVPVCLATTGCGPGYYHHGRFGCAPHRTDGTTAALTLAASIFMLAAEASHDSEPREVIVAAPPPPTVVVVPYGPPAPPRVTAAEPTHAAFDGMAALAALHAVDLSACHAPDTAH